MVAALMKATGAAMNFAKAAVQTYASFEQIENGLSGVLGSAEKGKEFFEEMRSFSFETTFGVDTLSAAATQLLNIGVASNKVKPSLKMLGDVAGGNTEKFNELVSIYAKIQNTGKASAMQLQQLALRGVPIYQVLKDIGVEGKASAEDITHAFEKMTTEFDEATQKAGIFYNNMERINDTIQGREGFVSDTWREMLAGFAEAAGLATAYKAILDLVYEKLQGFVDVLAVINSNPVYQALFKGALVAGVTALAVVIAGPLITALNATIAKLGIIAALKAAISPAALAAGIAAVVAGGAVTLLSLSKNAKEAADSEDELTKATRQLIGEEKSLTTTMGSNTVVLKEQTLEIGNQVFELKELAKAYEEVNSKEHKKGRKKIAKSLKTDGIAGMDSDTANQYLEYLLQEAQAEVYYTAQTYFQNLNEFGKDNTITKDTYVEYQDAINNLARVKKAYDGVLESQKAINKAEEEHNKLIQQVKDSEDAFAEAVAKIESEYTSTDEGKKWSLEKQIEEYKAMRELTTKKIVDLRNPNNGEVIGEGVADNLKMEETHLHMIDVIIAKLTEDLKNTGKKANDVKKEIEPFQKALQGLFNFSDTDVPKFLDTTIHGLEVYANRVEEEAKALAPYWDILHGVGETKLQSDTSSLKSQLDNYKKILNTMLTSRDEKTGNLIWQGNEASIQKVVDKVKELEKELNDSEFRLEIEGLEEASKKIGQTARALRELELEKEGYSKEQIAVIADKEFNQKFQEALLTAKQQRAEIGKTNLELYKMQAIQEGFNEKQAESLAMFKEETEMIQQMADATYLNNQFNEMVRIAAETYNANGRQDFDAGSYAKGKAGMELMSIIQGTDVGNFVEGFQEGGVMGGVINTLIKALADVVGGIEGLNVALSPIRQLFKAFEPLIKALLYPLVLLGQLLAKLGEVIMKVLNFITFGLVERLSVKFDSLVQSSDNLAEQQQSEADRLKALNDQYKSLMAAIDEQNQYYLKKKMEVNADAYNRALSGTSVNDMILTPQGNFSTDPNDYIIATKNPQSLGGGGNTVVQMMVKINNTIANTASVKTTQTTNADGIPELSVVISQKIAGDAATGANGWDDAFTAREQRLAGRSVTV